MRRKLLTTLILCVALLTQLGASVSGAAAARDGAFRYAKCHPQAVAGKTPAQPRAPLDRDAPVHHHADCSFCQSGLADTPTLGTGFIVQLRHAAWRVSTPDVDAPAIPFMRNKSAAARAPPLPA